PVQAEGEAGLRDPLSAEDLGEVVRASSADLFLRAEIGGVDLEDHAGVVIEAADDPHVERVILSGDSIRIEEVGDFLEVLESRAPRTLEDSCGLVEDRSVPRELDEGPQRLREIRPTQPGEFGVEHRKIPFVKGMQDD